MPTLGTTTKFFCMISLSDWHETSLKKRQLIRNYARKLNLIRQICLDIFNHKLCNKSLSNTSRNIWFRYLLELPPRGDSKKYWKHTFYNEIRINQCLSYTWSLSILYNNKFIFLAIPFGINAVVLTRDHCTQFGIIIKHWKKRLNCEKCSLTWNPNKIVR